MSSVTLFCSFKTISVYTVHSKGTKRQGNLLSPPYPVAQFSPPAVIVYSSRGSQNSVYTVGYMC